MQYQSNPHELWTVVKERHDDWLREAATARHIQQAKPATAPLATRLVALVQGMAHRGKQRFTQARTPLSAVSAE